MIETLVQSGLSCPILPRRIPLGCGACCASPRAQPAKLERAAMRLIKLSFLFLVLLVSKPVSAQSVIDQITGQLRAQGFSKIEVSDTWLGRARIEAKSRDWEREIIVNPRTGEILRDYSKPFPRLMHQLLMLSLD